jgi:hypothetical protein
MSPQAELALRKRQLNAREGKAGYTDNVKELQARIAELEQQIGEG